MKRFILFFMVICIFFAPASFSFAASNTSGSLGNIEWEIKNGVLKISGEGALPDFTNDSENAWRNKKIGYKSIKKVEISDGITAIGNYCFYGFDGLNTIIIPSTVERIGVNAICSNALKKIEIPASVTSIETSSFNNSKNLVELVVSEDNEAYSSSAGMIFSKDMKTLILCPRGKAGKVSVPSGTEILNESCFYSCSKITNIELPKSINEIQHGAFLMCSSLASISLPEGISEIPDQCFENCSKLKNIAIPGTVTKIGSWAFSGTNIEKIEIPSSVTSLDYASFYQCASLKEIYLPDSITDVGVATFMGCTSLKTANISTFFTCHIGYTGITKEYETSKYIFRDCEKLETIIVRGGEYISEGAFLGCFNIKSITITPSIITIYSDAFEENLSVSKITVHCFKNSKAEEWATEKGFIIESIEQIE